MSAQNEALEKANPPKLLIVNQIRYIEGFKGLRKEIQKDIIFDQHIALCLVNEGSTISFSILCCVENEKLWVLMSSFHVRSLMHSTLLEDPVFV
jgi:hypothetical protein